MTRADVIQRRVYARTCKVLGTPARDRFAGVVVHADDDGEDDEQRDRVAIAETIGEVVIVLLRATRLREGVH